MVRGGLAFIHCELPDGTVGQIPAWMTDAVACERMVLGDPQVPLSVLTELRLLVDAIVDDGAVARNGAAAARGPQSAPSEKQGTVVARESSVAARDDVPSEAKKEKHDG